MSTPWAASTSGQRAAVAVGEAAQHVEVEGAHRRRAAEQAAAEPGAFLVGPVDERHRHRRDAVGGQRPQQLEPGHHARARRRASRPSGRCRGGCRRRACRRWRPAAPPTGCRRRRCRPRRAASRSSSRSSDRASSHSGVHARRREPSGPAGAGVELAEVGHDAGRVVGGAWSTSPDTVRDERHRMSPGGVESATLTFDCKVPAPPGRRRAREDDTMPKYLLLIVEDESAFESGGQASSTT